MIMLKLFYSVILQLVISPLLVMSILSSTTTEYNICVTNGTMQTIKYTDPVHAHNTVDDIFHGGGVTAIGDLNLDGVPDLAVGAPRYKLNPGVSGGSGAVFIYFLRANFSEPEQVLALAEGTTPVSLPALPSTSDKIFIGYALANMGDLNGDGIQDLAVGAEEDNYRYSSGYSNNRGSVYLVYLSRTGHAIAWDKIGYAEGGFDWTDGGNGLTLTSIQQSVLSFGKSLANIGDVDGDSFVDIAIGSTVVAQASNVGHQGCIWFISLQQAVGGHASDGGTGTVVKAQQMFWPGGGYSTTERYNASILMTLPLDDPLNPCDPKPTCIMEKLNLGDAITAVGDWDNNGITDIVTCTIDSFGDVGRIYLALLQSPAPYIVTTFKLLTQVGMPESHSVFNTWGYSLASLPDLDGNGLPELLVGDRFYRRSSTNPAYYGGVFIVSTNSDFEASSWRRLSAEERNTVLPYNMENDGIFAFALGVVENIDGGGSVHMVVSAPQSSGRPVFLIPYNHCDCTGTASTGRHCEWECYHGGMNDPASFTICNCDNTNAYGNRCQNSCNTGVLYFNDTGSPFCNCTNTGFEGILCDQDIDDCLSFPCLNDGVCVDNGTYAYNCFCGETGYYGVHCENEFISCLSSPCANNGGCTEQPEDNSKGFDCDCDGTGFEGLQCEDDVNDCVSSPCLNEGVCNDGVLAYTCNCTDTGYEGTNCEINVDDCTPDSCQNNGTCTDRSDTINRVSCECKPGFEGKKCDVNLDDCLSQPCLNGGLCVDLPTGAAFTCNCSEVFPPVEGTLCELEINQCDSSPCPYSEMCEWKQGKGRYSCVGIAADPCLSYPCMNGDTCVPSTSSPTEYTCESPPPPTNDCGCWNGGTCLLDGTCDCGLNYGGDVCEIDLTGLQCVRLHVYFEDLIPNEELYIAALPNILLMRYNTSFVEKLITVTTGVILNVCVAGRITGGGLDSNSTSVLEDLKELGAFEEPTIDNYLVDINGSWTSSGVQCGTCVEIVIEFNLNENATLEELVYDAQSSIAVSLNAEESDVMIISIAAPANELTNWTLIPIESSGTDGYAMRVMFVNDEGYEDEAIISMIIEDDDSTINRKSTDVDVTVIDRVFVVPNPSQNDKTDTSNEGSGALLLQILLFILLAAVIVAGVYFFVMRQKKKEKKSHAFEIPS